MNKKKHKIFLWISLAFFVLSVIAVLAPLIESYFELKDAFLNEPVKNDHKWGDQSDWLIIVSVFLIFPAFPVELSCIRSVYKILKYEPKGVVKVCYVVSAVLSLSAFVFQCLVFSGVIDLVDESGSPRLYEGLLLLTEWPVFIISFILGSIKNRDGNDIEQTLS